MNNFNRKEHWETIYQTKELKDVSWYQLKPETSLDFLVDANIPKNAKIIDIGGGDSFLVDHLLELGYQDITVLDVSEKALERAKERLGNNASKVKWIVEDVITFQAPEKYDFWHDRAAFHFLTEPEEIRTYVSTVEKSLNPSGTMVVGTFSDRGPEKCSGIAIKQYSATALTETFTEKFEKLKCISLDHETPSDKIQNFVFCSFRKK